MKRMRGTPNLEGIGVTSAGFRSDPQALPCQQVSTRLLSVCEDASKALKRGTEEHNGICVQPCSDNPQLSQRLVVCS